MSEKMAGQEEIRLTFSDEDFESRYSTEEAIASASGAGRSSRPATQHPQPLATPIGRSRNKFMRTLLRRRLYAAGTT
jgi:hypothetical protein